MGYTKSQLLDRLKELEIEFHSYEHPVVMTVEAQAKYVGHLEGGLSKNLLLKDKKQRFYMVSVLSDTNVDLKVLSQRLGLGKGGLRMAPEEALQEILQVPLGSVTPFALINESARNVSLLLDQGFKAHKYCSFHPLSNDMTVSLSVPGLEKFLASTGRQASYVDLKITPLIGKDQPPDLANFVPSGTLLTPSNPEVKVPSELPIESHVEVKNVSRVIQGKSSEFNHGHSQVDNKATNSSSLLVEVANVEKFVNRIIEKTAAIILSEVTKGQTQQHEDRLGSILIDNIKKRLTPDLQGMVVQFKNAAYTQGYNSSVKR